jgi:hypothetical protein
MPCVSLNRYVFCVMAQLAIVEHLFEHAPARASTSGVFRADPQRPETDRTPQTIDSRPIAMTESTKTIAR